MVGIIITEETHFSQYLGTFGEGEQCQVFLQCTLVPFLLGGRMFMAE